MSTAFKSIQENSTACTLPYSGIARFPCDSTAFLVEGLGEGRNHLSSAF